MRSTKELIKISRFRVRGLYCDPPGCVMPPANTFVNFVCSIKITEELSMLPIQFLVTSRGPGKCKFRCPLPKTNFRYLSLKRVCRQVCTLRQRHAQTILQKVISPTAEAWTLYRVSGLMAINLTKGINLSLAFPYKLSMKRSWRVKKTWLLREFRDYVELIWRNVISYEWVSTRWHIRKIKHFLRCLSVDFEIHWEKQGSLISSITFSLFIIWFVIIIIVTELRTG
jgi:hypothetical protein